MESSQNITEGVVNVFGQADRSQLTSELEPRIETECRNKAEYDEILEKQTDLLAKLKAHMKTMVTALAGHTVSMTHPVPLDYSPAGGPIVIDCRYPIYILNIGVTRGDQAMSGYKVMRKFWRHIESKSEREEIMYTTIVLGGIGQRYYIIRDDDNNMWKGANAFDMFRRSFSVHIPFTSIDDWLGLGYPEIRRYFSYPKPVEMPSRQSILDKYFGF